LQDPRLLTNGRGERFIEGLNPDNGRLGRYRLEARWYYLPPGLSQNQALVQANQLERRQLKLAYGWVPPDQWESEEW